MSAMPIWVEKWYVIGSTGNEYTVSKSDHGEFGCSCPAWKFNRKHCKHIAQIQQRLVSSTPARATRATTTAIRNRKSYAVVAVEEPREPDKKWYL